MKTNISETNLPVVRVPAPAEIVRAFVIDEDAIAADLERAGVTDARIAELRDKFSGMTIAGVDDVVGYERVKRARLDVRKVRTTVEKVCKSGREEANKIAKLWIAAEKRIVASVSEIEDALAAEERRVDEERERLEREAREREFRRGQIENRVRMLSELGRTATFEEMERLSDDEFLALVSDIRKAEEAERERLAAAERARRAEEERLIAEERAKLQADRDRLERAIRLEHERAKRLEHERAVTAASADTSAKPDRAPDLGISDAAVSGMATIVGAFAQSIGAPTEDEFFPGAERADAIRSESGAEFFSGVLSGDEDDEDDRLQTRYAVLRPVVDRWRQDIGAPASGRVLASSADLDELAIRCFLSGLANKP